MGQPPRWPRSSRRVEETFEAEIADYAASRLRLVFDDWMLERDLTALAVPLAGVLEETGSRWEPCRLLDPAGSRSGGRGVLCRPAGEGPFAGDGAFLWDGRAAVVPVVLGERDAPGTGQPEQRPATSAGRCSSRASRRGRTGGLAGSRRRPCRPGRRISRGAPDVQAGRAGRRKLCGPARAAAHGCLPQLPLTDVQLVLVFKQCQSQMSASVDTCAAIQGSRVNKYLRIRRGVIASECAAHPIHAPTSQPHIRKCGRQQCT